MTADLINLRRARKNVKRDAAEKLAQENRVKFGRNAVERKITKFETAKQQTELDGKKRDV